MDSVHPSRPSLQAELVLYVTRLFELEASDDSANTARDSSLSSDSSLQYPATPEPPYNLVHRDRFGEALSQGEQRDRGIQDVKKIISQLLKKAWITEKTFYDTIRNNRPTLAVMAAMEQPRRMDISGLTDHIQRDIARQTEFADSLWVTLRELVYCPDVDSYSWNQARGLEDYIEFQH